MSRKKENLRFSGQSQANETLLLFHELTSKSLGTSGSGTKEGNRKLEKLFHMLQTFRNKYIYIIHIKSLAMLH